MIQKKKNNGAFVTCSSLAMVLALGASAHAAGVPQKRNTASAAPAPAVSDARFDEILRTRKPRNVISFEALGRAMFYSLNYDRALSPFVSVGLGVSYLGLKSTDEGQPRSMVIVPVYSNIYFSKSATRLFVTGGVDLVHISGEISESSGLERTNVAPIGGLGFEYRHDNGFVFRLTPYIALAPNPSAWVGASLGASF
jgi:hypothetical protein